MKQVASEIYFEKSVSEGGRRGGRRCFVSEGGRQGGRSGHPSKEAPIPSVFLGGRQGGQYRPPNTPRRGWPAGQGSIRAWHRPPWTLKSFLGTVHTQRSKCARQAGPSAEIRYAGKNAALNVCSYHEIYFVLTTVRHRAGSGHHQRRVTDHRAFLVDPGSICELSAAIPRH